MIKFNSKGLDELSFHEIFEEALKIQTRSEAKQYLHDYAEWIKNKGAREEPIKEPIEIAKENFGYWAGYYSNEVRRKVEGLFECEHPVFGSIEKNGPPTPAQAFALGLEMAARSKSNDKTKNKQ